MTPEIDAIITAARHVIDETRHSIQLWVGAMGKGEHGSTGQFHPNPLDLEDLTKALAAYDARSQTPA